MDGSRVVMDEAADLEMLANVNACADRLRQEARRLDRCILAAHKAGISNYRIAAAYGVTESTVRARLKRIKQ